MQQRPRPDDFRAIFIALGWRGAIAHYETHGRTIHRWMHEEGWDGLVADRAAYRSRLQDRDRAFRLRAATRHFRSAGEPSPSTVNQGEQSW